LQRIRRTVGEDLKEAHSAGVGSHQREEAGKILENPTVSFKEVEGSTVPRNKTDDNDTPAEKPAEEDTAQTDRTPKTLTFLIPPTEESQPLTAAGKTAARVFDQFDTKKTGSLTVSTFEEMLDELGEGFHGDKYDAQIALIDPSQYGKIAWASFIHWYATLIEGVGGDDDGLLDSEEIAEHAEEEEKARKAFRKFAKIKNGV
jgi:hypothetical protein